MKRDIIKYICIDLIGNKIVGWERIQIFDQLLGIRFQVEIKGRPAKFLPIIFDFGYGYLLYRGWIFDVRSIA